MWNFTHLLTHIEKNLEAMYIYFCSVHRKGKKKEKVPEITKSWGCESRKYVGKFTSSQSRKQSAGKAGIKHWLLQHRIKGKQNLVYSSWGTYSKCRAYPCRCCDPGKNPLHSSPGTGPGAMPEGRNRRCSEWPEVPGTWSMKRDKLIKKQSTLKQPIFTPWE